MNQSVRGGRGGGAGFFVGLPLTSGISPCTADLAPGSSEVDILGSSLILAHCFVPRAWSR